MVSIWVKCADGDGKMTKTFALIVGFALVFLPAGPVRAGEATKEDGASQPPARSSSSWRKSVFWTATGGALAAAGFGVFAVVKRNSSVDDFNAARTPDGQTQCLENVPGYGGPACQTFHDRANRWRTTAFLALGSSLALATAAVVLNLTEPSSSPMLERVSLGWMPQAGFSASYRLRF